MRPAAALTAFVTARAAFPVASGVVEVIAHCGAGLVPAALRSVAFSLFLVDEGEVPGLDLWGFFLPKAALLYTSLKDEVQPCARVLDAGVGRVCDLLLK